jgi:hypothetical protein
MRFSSIFQLPLPRSNAVPVAPGRVKDQDATLSGYESTLLPVDDYSQMPEELDQRVRLVGEWQLGMD